MVVKQEKVWYTLSMAEEKTPQETIVNAGTVIGSTYSQLANVTVSDIDITLEFAFINPRDPSKGQVVSRVTLPLKVGLELARLIETTYKMHEKKKEGKHND